jgi:hypothetical protein
MQICPSAASTGRAKTARAGLVEVKLKKKRLQTNVGPQVRGCHFVQRARTYKLLPKAMCTGKKYIHPNRQKKEGKNKEENTKTEKW